MRPSRALFLCLALGLGSPGVMAQEAQTTKPPANPTAGKAGAKGQPEQPDKSTIGQGRDWTKIDTNKDGYISPEEMEVWLKANPATPSK